MKLIQQKLNKDHKFFSMKEFYISFQLQIEQSPSRAKTTKKSFNQSNHTIQTKTFAFKCEENNREKNVFLSYLAS